MIENALRVALVEHLRGDPALQSKINSVTEEAPSRASPPWLAVVASASTDWSVKGRTGREVRVALELQMRGDDPHAASAMVQAVQDRVESLPRMQAGFELVTTTFLRARMEQRVRNTRAALVEYRFRAFAD